MARSSAVLAFEDAMRAVVKKLARYETPEGVAKHMRRVRVVGCRSNSWRCPLANYLIRELHKRRIPWGKISVGITTMSAWTPTRMEYATVVLPKFLVEFIDMVDNRVLDGKLVVDRDAAFKYADLHPSVHLDQPPGPPC